MRANSVVMLAVAILFGAVAVYLANMWLAAQSRQQVQVVQAPAVETATIVVATTDLSFGTIISPENVREIPWPKTSMPDGAFATVAELTSNGQRAALASISPNEPILKWKISGPDARASLSALVGPGMRAAAIRVNDIVGVGGFVLPGDRVDVLYTRNAKDEKEYSSTDVLIQNVRVLAVDQLADQKKNDPVVAKVVTVEVSTIDAQKIALAQTTGSLTLTLRSAGSMDAAPAQRIVEQELVSSPSVYQDAIDAQNAAQNALDNKVKSLESRLADIANQAVTSKEELKTDLLAKLAMLEKSVKDASKSAGEGDVELRNKLAQLETAIGLARSAGGETAEQLRARLAQFEASLRDIAASSNRPVVITPTADVPAVVTPATANVGVTRGTKRETYQVPVDETAY
jgi:pilus assembly protein CpaB